MAVEMQVVAKFDEIFGSEGKKEIFFTPGRVNLIGEHIDYNGGYVFPCALSFGTYAVCRRRDDDIFRMYSMNFEKDGIVEFSLKKLIKTDVWADYCKGVIDTFIKHGYKIEHGADIVFFGNIPNGAGLSSSASLEVLMGTIIREISGLNDKVSMIDIVKFGQEAENKFIGVNCGIMDQFAVGMGKEDKAILLNCDTLEYDYVPVKLDGISIVIMNTNKRRGLGESKYNERRASCEAALKDIQEAGKKINHLCDMTMEDFEEVKKYIKSEEAVPRVRHAVSENVRVLESVKCLKENDIEKFGKLMNGSHISLRDDYEVTGKELDAIVAAAWEQEGTVGARMTGAGFGGCAVSLVKNEFIDEYSEHEIPVLYQKNKIENNYCVITAGIAKGHDYPYRGWNIEKFAHVANFISANTDLIICLSGTNDDEVANSELYSMIKNKRRVINLTAKTSFDEWVEVLRNAEFIFGNDSGYIHLASMLRTKSFVIAGFWNYGRFLPYGDDVEVCAKPIDIRIDKPKCALCSIIKHNCMEKVACDKKVLKDGIYKCIDDITSEMAIEAVKSHYISPKG